MLLSPYCVHSSEPGAVGPYKGGGTDPVEPVWKVLVPLNAHTVFQENTIRGVFSTLHPPPSEEPRAQTRIPKLCRHFAGVGTGRRDDGTRVLASECRLCLLSLSLPRSCSSCIKYGGTDPLRRIPGGRKRDTVCKVQGRGNTEREWPLPRPFFHFRVFCFLLLWIPASVLVLPAFSPLR